MKLFRYLAVAGALIFTLGSCEDYLTEVNPNEISTDSFWRNLEDCEMGMIAVYNQFRNPSIMSVAEETNRSDLSWPGWGRPSTSNEEYLQTFTEASNGLNNKWDALYKGIFRANQVIEGLEGIQADMSSEEDMERWTDIMAQTRFFRGLFYFYLHNSFNEGSVIIFDDVPEAEADFYKQLSPAEEVQAFFRADLEYAYENLPARWSGYTEGNLIDPQEAGKATAGAAAAVLGKSYLYEEDYTTAAEYFKDVIDNYGYQLVDVSENFTTKGELNQESILEVVYSLNHKPEEDQWSAKGTTNTYNLMFSPVGGWRTVYPSNWLILEYKNDSIDINDPRNTVIDDAGNPVYRKYSLRTSYSIALVDDSLVSYYGKTTAQATPFNNRETAYFRKNTNWDIFENEKDSEPTQRSGINYRVIRLADVYLMYAECLIEGGANDAGVEQALTYINRVRNRSALQLLGPVQDPQFGNADVDGKTYDAQAVMDHLMYVERPLELAAEGHAIRHIDMRRWGIKKERFQELAKKRYYADHFPYIDEKGNPLTRWGSVLQEYTGQDGIEPDLLLNEFEQAAQNYIPSQHAYWPVPNSETIANPDL